MTCLATCPCDCRGNCHHLLGNVSCNGLQLFCPCTNAPFLLNGKLNVQTINSESCLFNFKPLPSLDPFSLALLGTLGLHVILLNGVLILQSKVLNFHLFNFKSHLLSLNTCGCGVAAPSSCRYLYNMLCKLYCVCHIARHVLLKFNYLLDDVHFYA